MIWHLQVKGDWYFVKELDCWIVRKHRDKHLPFSCDVWAEVDHSLFSTSCPAKMPTEPILLLSQLCPGCGQWSAAVYPLCPQQNQNSLRPVSSLGQKLYFSSTFRAFYFFFIVNIPTSWNEKRRTQKERVSWWQYPMQDAEPHAASGEKRPFLICPHQDTFENMFMCQIGFPLNLHYTWPLKSAIHTSWAEVTNQTG